ncbi:hypothetical protein EI427_24100 [Flammeovirga pectinis]|uniref:7(1) septoil knot domain-containing protein n=1 Tax=Flammeovirga pectinis TaxID=2494373 RepID=A0A3S9PAP2_9BACT|nr:DUF6150 family protein [Flammeovirga pectinis]AZQ65301.1 hypothetical protein EI427_24100 [Flammeovirga pectinis]
MKFLSLYLLSICMLLGSLSCSMAGANEGVEPKPKVFIVTEKWKADKIVKSVTNAYQADITISPNSWDSSADWILVDQLYKADMKIFLTSKSYEADYLVFFK